MKFGVTLLLLAVGIISPAPRAWAQAADAAPAKRQVVLVGEFTTPIIFNGQEIGRKVVATGTVLEVRAVTATYVECLQGKQVIRIPTALVKWLEPAPEIPPATPSTPANTPSAPKPDDAPTVPSKAAAQEGVALPLPAGEEGDLEAVGRYLESFRSSTRSSPTASRFLRYQSARAFSPLAQRPRVARLLGENLSPARHEGLQALQAAFVCYEHSAWSAYETSMRKAADLFLGPEPKS